MASSPNCQDIQAFVIHQGPHQRQVPCPRARVKSQHSSNWMELMSPGTQKKPLHRLSERRSPCCYRRDSPENTLLTAHSSVTHTHPRTEGPKQGARRSLLRNSESKHHLVDSHQVKEPQVGTAELTAGRPMPRTAPHRKAPAGAHGRTRHLPQRKTTAAQGGRAPRGHG